MHTSSETAPTIEIVKSPLGPMTLPEQISVAEYAGQIQERMRQGNGFMPGETIARTQKNQEDFHARMELLLEAHPQLAGMYAEHAKLHHEYHEKINEGVDVTDLQAQCAELAHQIVALEQSIDLGSNE